MGSSAVLGTVRVLSRDGIVHRFGSRMAREPLWGIVLSWLGIIRAGDPLGFCSFAVLSFVVPMDDEIMLS